ncbi:MAG: hypothetical protein ABI972_16740 [Acidobacteriota bacterium]
MESAFRAHAPEELTRTTLRRLGEGIGKVVYASEHWVVKRQRTSWEMVALIVLWRVVRKGERYLPGGLGERLLAKPSRQIRFLRVMIQGLMRVLPMSVWLTTHVREVWRVYRSRDIQGERVAAEYLVGTNLMPRTIRFPPARVRVNGWPGELTVTEATERVEATLHQRLAELAAAGRFKEVGHWLERFLQLRQSGWRRGVFSLDAHLKNYGVSGERIVLLDAGGLTDRWEEVEGKLELEEVVAQPHIQLGLGDVLGGRPDLARRFDERWKAIVSRASVEEHWPAEPDSDVTSSLSAD